ncbi:MAG: hypothetical protein R2710_28665 [Acidimicrobiales bacterium]
MDEHRGPGRPLRESDGRRETSRPLESVLGMDATVVPEVREFDAEDPSYIPLEDLTPCAGTVEELRRIEASATAPVLRCCQPVAHRDRGPPPG